MGFFTGTCTEISTFDVRHKLLVHIHNRTDSASETRDGTVDPAGDFDSHVESSTFFSPSRSSKSSLQTYWPHLLALTLTRNHCLHGELKIGLLVIEST
jgi:hypothetical protein